MSSSHSKIYKKKNVWQLQEAKAKFSQLVEDANEKGYQTITKHGKPIAVILSKKEFDKITNPQTSLLNFFKAAPCQETELDLQRIKELPTYY